MAKLEQRGSVAASKTAGTPGPQAEAQGAFFRACDWLAFGVTFVIAMAAYICTQSPTVTLEDSGELIVAADYLGVPHPPGYPLWSLMGWIFKWIFHMARYMGQPNPAWGVTVMSGFFGALSAAVVALVVSRSGWELIRFRRAEIETTESQITKAMGVSSGVAAGLLLAFTPLLWSQCVIAEVYSLNTFVHVAILALAYLWMNRPKDNRILYWMALMFGLAFTNCQPIVLLIPGIMVMIFMTDRRLFWDLLALGLIMSAGFVFYRINEPELSGSGPMPHKELWVTAAVLLLASPLAILLFTRRLFTEWRRVLLMVLFGAIGLSFFVYMPIAGDFNPPMNWGYPRTMEGFRHAVTRGQYQALTPALAPMAMLDQTGAYFEKLDEQFPLPLILLPLILLFPLRHMNRKEWGWLGCITLGFLVTGVGMIILMNPGHDQQSMFIAEVQFIQSTAIYAFAVGYGLMLGQVFLASAVRSPVFQAGLAALVMLVPSVQFWKNLADQDMRGHDFGWQFGNYQLRGAAAIQEELKPGEPPLPNPNYPPAMGPGAVFFGGTDPGRFVPTYMIYSAKVRPDVFLITQNALADNTYMNVMRDLYGDYIWMPTPQDTNLAFQQYVSDVKAGRIPPSAAINIDRNGKVSVQGVAGVMEINGIICKMIFEANKHKHDFYVEESYVIAWMYPYLEPHGLILKINKEPLPALTPEMIKNDMDFWTWYSRRLLADTKFQHDEVAQKSFSKLRCAIAGVYASRRMFNEAEAAFRQAIALYPLSPEANFRLSDMYLQIGRFDEARTIMENNLRMDPKNDKIAGFLNQIRDLERMNARINELQAQLAGGTGTLDQVFELASLFQRSGREQPFVELTRRILQDTNVPPPAYLKIAEMYGGGMPPRWPLVVEAYQRYLTREPGDPRIWLELACAQCQVGANDQALQALRQAVALGGEPIKDKAGKDQRLAPLWNTELFRKLVTPAQQPLPFSGGFLP